MSPDAGLPVDSITDALNRPVISDSIKSKIEMAFQQIPPGKKGALLVISDGNGTRGMLAGKLVDSKRWGEWKVAAGGGYEFSEKKPYGYVAIAGAW